jgi:hypothetical protein
MLWKFILILYLATYGQPKAKVLYTLEFYPEDMVAPVVKLENATIDDVSDKQLFFSVRDIKYRWKPGTGLYKGDEFLGNYMLVSFVKTGQDDDTTMFPPDSVLLK